MKCTRTDLPDVLLLEPAVFGDHRGFFFESYNEARYREAGLDARFVQDNFSFSAKGTLRGLHFQNPGPQGKLVSCIDGSVYDVAVDLRRSSPTFGKWFGLTLSSENRRQLFIPEGFAHGFLVQSENALFHYKCTDLYRPASEGVICWNDPDLGIPWPVESPILSPRDASAARLRDLGPDRLFP